MVPISFAFKEVTTDLVIVSAAATTAIVDNLMTSSSMNWPLFGPFAGPVGIFSALVRVEARRRGAELAVISEYNSYMHLSYFAEEPIRK